MSRAQGVGIDTSLESVQGAITRASFAKYQSPHYHFSMTYFKRGGGVSSVLVQDPPPSLPSGPT